MIMNIYELIIIFLNDIIIYCVLSFINLFSCVMYIFTLFFVSKELNKNKYIIPRIQPSLIHDLFYLI